MSAPFGPSDTRELLAVLIADMVNRLPEQEPTDAPDPALALERMWMALERKHVHINRKWDAIRAEMMVRNGDPRLGGSYGKWLCDPDYKILDDLGNDMEMLTEQQGQIRARMAEVEATTIAGLHAKLNIVAYELPNWQPPVLPPVSLELINQTIRVLAEVPV